MTGNFCKVPHKSLSEANVSGTPHPASGNSVSTRRYKWFQFTGYTLHFHKLKQRYRQDGHKDLYVYVDYITFSKTKTKV